LTPELHASLSELHILCRTVYTLGRADITTDWVVRNRCGRISNGVQVKTLILSDVVVWHWLKCCLLLLREIAGSIDVRTNIGLSIATIRVLILQKMKVNYLEIAKMHQNAHVYR